MKTVFKKTGILALIILFSAQAFGQDVKTKTEKFDYTNLSTTRTYSYYLDKSGKEVLHGKYAISTKYTSDGIKGEMSVVCNYKNGKLHGLFTYKSNVIHYVDVIQNFRKVWIQRRHCQDDYSVDMYEGRMNGKINITHGTAIPMSPGTNYKGTAEQGVLVDGVDFVVGSGSLKETWGTFRNIKSAKSPDRNLAEIKNNNGPHISPIEISFTTSVRDRINKNKEIFVLELPLFVDKNFDKLSDIPEYKDFLKKENIDFTATNSTFQKIKKDYYLSKKDEDALYFKLLEMLEKDENFTVDIETDRFGRSKDGSYYSSILRSFKVLKENEDIQNKREGALFDKAKARAYAKKETAQKMAQEKNDRYRSLYKEVDNIVKNQSFRISAYTNSGGKIKYDKIVEDMITGRYNTFLDTLKRKNTFDFFGKQENGRRGASGSMIYTHVINDQAISELSDFLTLLKENNLRMSKVEAIKKKVSDIAGYYTKTGNSSSGVIKNKALYNAYLDVTGYFVEKSKVASIAQLDDIFTSFDKVCDKMLDKNSDIEKRLKKAKTTEEKLAIFLN